jgi:hypothetical protein
LPWPRSAPFRTAVARHGTPASTLTDIQTRWRLRSLVGSAGLGQDLRDRRPSAAVA